jgi:hypothetical protein
MLKCTMLLPTQDNAGRNVLKEGTDFMEKLLRKFGGWTEEGLCHGAYIMADGTAAKDVLYKVSVVIDKVDLEELKDMLANLAVEMRQECMYLEVSEPEVGFIKHVRADEVLPMAEAAVDWPTGVQRPSAGLCAPSIGEAVQAEDRQLHSGGARFSVVRDVIERLARGEEFVEVSFIRDLNVSILKKLGYKCYDYGHKGNPAVVVTK